MKINKITFSISILLGLLISFFLSKYTLEKNILIFSIGCFITITTGISGLISIKFINDKIAVNAKVFSAIYFLIATTIQILFTVFNNFEIGTYLFMAFGSLLVYILILYNLMKTKM